MNHSQPNPSESYEPTQQDIDFLNEVDKGVVGVTKPKINVTQDEGLTVPRWHKDVEDHDDDAASAFEAWA